MITRGLLKAPFDSALLQEAVIVPHQQMRFHLPHRVQHYSDNDEHAGSTKELGYILGNAHFIRQQDGNYGYDGKEDSTGQSYPTHSIVQEVAGGLSRSNTRNITTVLLEIVSNLQFVKLSGNPEVRKENCVPQTQMKQKVYMPSIIPAKCYVPMHRPSRHGSLVRQRSLQFLRRYPRAS